MNTKSPFESGQKYRMTHQRQVILDEIRKVTTHPTADEVYELVRKRLPRISLGTVYRNLEILAARGLIKRIGPASQQMRFDGVTEDHYHLRCVSCGRVEDAPIISVGDLEDAVRNQSDYSITGHRLEFLGICPECRGKETSFRKNV
ncbi:MAG: transcriptional repressor [Deltaproteobacteria bacterium]|nr:MAG: transcriptional repressor [Deltaproteobacteria bacterium]